MKQFVLQSCFLCIMYYFYVCIIRFDECAARCVHLFPQEEECTSSSWGDSKMYTSTRIANSQRMQTEINKSSTIANNDLSQKWYCQTLKVFRITSSKIKVSLLILSWWCFNFLHIQRIGTQFTDQIFWKIIPIGTVDTILINKL